MRGFNIAREDWQDQWEHEECRGGRGKEEEEGEEVLLQTMQSACCCCTVILSFSQGLEEVLQFVNGGSATQRWWTMSLIIRGVAGRTLFSNLHPRLPVQTKC